MKRTILTMMTCLSSVIAMAQYGTQFNNRGFETWANFGSNANTNEPVHWHSSKSASGTFSGMLSQQIEPSSIVRPGSVGSKSARLWPTSILGITANGNMTNGRMNAGSMSATGSSNYNYTQRSDERFNTPITTVPDSVAVWVCFRSADPYQEAELKAAIHGDVDMKFLSSGSLEPADQLVATATHCFTRTADVGGNHTWRRLSVPFVQNGPCNDPRYILLTITTNKVPGEGSTSDDLLVDDILLIYNPSIQMGALEKDHYLIGESVTIPFTLTGTMSAENLNEQPNMVISQLSNAIGSFSNPIELGRMTTNTSGQMTVNIPQGILSGTGYRIRLVTTNYPMISEDNGFDISISSGVAVKEQKEVDFDIVPNPASNFVHFVSNQVITGVEMYNQTGHRVYSQILNTKDHELSTNSFAPGIYLVRCSIQQQELLRKLVIQ